MSNFNDYFMNEYRYALTNISYTKLPAVPVPDRDDSPDIYVQDSLTIGAKVGTHIHVALLRIVEFQPESNFKLSVEFDMIFEFQKSVDPDSVQDIEIVQVLEAAPFISEVISKASLLISQITLIGSSTPMILPPNYINNTECE